MADDPTRPSSVTQSGDKTQDEPSLPESGQILRLRDFGADPTLRIVADMREYWASLRQGRAVPARADVEPRGIRRGLDYAFIIERIAPGAARFRLAGRHLIDLMGMEVRGMPLCAVVNSTSRGRLSDVLETVFKAPQIVEIDLLAYADYARPELRAKLLLMPLKSDLGDVTRALGCLVSHGEIGVAPRRFDMKEVKVSTIIDGAEPMLPSPSMRGFHSNDSTPWKKAATKEVGRSAAPAAPTPQTPQERRATFQVISRDR